MNAALRNLLEGSIDYAGLFPPANLQIERAAQIFSTDKQGLYQAYLRHFVLPAKRINDFDSLRGNVLDQQWTLSILIGEGDTLHDWQASVEDAIRFIGGDGRGKSDPICALEIALPKSIAADECSFSQAIDAIELQITKTQLAGSDLFFETTTDSHRRVLAHVLCERQGGASVVGLKLRTGGIAQNQFPSVNQLSECVQLCHMLKIPWKATAGLHHPLPCVCPQTGLRMHGFLNLFFAVVLLEASLIDAEHLDDLLTDCNWEHFTFTDASMEWMGISANLDQIQSGRKRFISFGSCSFSEPIEDLVTLGLLSK